MYIKSQDDNLHTVENNNNLLRSAYQVKGLDQSLKIMQY